MIKFDKPTVNLSRRAALAGGSATGLLLGAGKAMAQATSVLVNTSTRPAKNTNAEHFVVYRNDREFAAWPYYCGLWKTADGSIVGGFKRVPSDYGRPDAVDHTNLTRNMGEIVVIRSPDNGRTWDQDSITHVFDMLIKEESDFPGGKADDWSSLPPLDFSDRDTLLMGGGIPALFANPAEGWMRASTDGGRTWRPHRLLEKDDFASVSIPGSSMYSLRGDGTMLFGVHTYAEGAQGPRPIVYATQNGRDFHYLGSMIDFEPKNPYYPGGSPFAAAPHFYPRPVVLNDGRVISALRYQRDARYNIWTEVHESLDGGRTWRWLSRVNDWGAPGDIVPMQDGRVVCVYGFRNAPQGIRYRISENGGLTWGREMILRDDGGSWDVGYPRVIEIEPGKLLSMYYINLLDDPIQMNGGVRHIACSIFEP
jgi:Neuraminidase (sialidase)